MSAQRGHRPRLQNSALPLVLSLEVVIQRARIRVATDHGMYGTIFAKCVFDHLGKIVSRILKCGTTAIDGSECEVRRGGAAGHRLIDKTAVAFDDAQKLE